MEGAKIPDGDNDKRIRSGRIGLDFDSKNRLQLLRGWFNANYFFPDTEIKVLETRKGYHLKIYQEHCLKQNFHVRRALNDDPVRLYFDEIRARRGLEDWVDTLFAVKWTPKGVGKEKPTHVLSEAFWTRMPCKKLR